MSIFSKTLFNKTLFNKTLFNKTLSAAINKRAQGEHSAIIFSLALQRAMGISTQEVNAMNHQQISFDIPGYKICSEHRCYFEGGSGWTDIVYAIPEYNDTGVGYSNHKPGIFPEDWYYYPGGTTTIIVPPEKTQQEIIALIGQKIKDN